MGKKQDAGERTRTALHKLTLAISLAETVAMAAEKFASDKDLGHIYYSLQQACAQLNSAYGELQSEVENG